MATENNKFRLFRFFFRLLVNTVDVLELGVRHRAAYLRCTAGLDRLHGQRVKKKDNLSVIIGRSDRRSWQISFNKLILTISAVTVVTVSSVRIISSAVVVVTVSCYFKKERKIKFTISIYLLKDLTLTVPAVAVSPSVAAAVSSSVACSISTGVSSLSSPSAPTY